MNMGTGINQMAHFDPRSVLALIFALAAILLTACSSDDAPVASFDKADSALFERAHSPSIGPNNASVTIVEFFDPACEACRAFYPYVKEILKRHPEDVRLVIRYAAFHDGSETVVRLLEAARQQQVYQAVLEALLIKQNEWASHHSPNIDRAWELAESAGLDIGKAKAILDSIEMDQLIAQENADLRAFKVSQTPTFYVNSKPLEQHGPDHLYQLVIEELTSSR